jgi:hypothetical protein
MIDFIHCVRRFAPEPVLTHHNNPLISTVWTSIRNSPRLHLNNRRDLSKVQGQLNPPSAPKTLATPVFIDGAGRRNRTDDLCVEGRCFTSKLYPRHQSA